MADKDNDALMIRAMGNAVTDLQVRYRAATLDDQAVLAGPLKEMTEDYSDHVARLIKAGTITSDDELAEMASIQKSITDKASRQDLLLAIAKIIALIAAS
ncbi:MAG TPA: hypothetical protein VI279_08430 [Rhodocyclaceae bacterium]